MTSAMSSKAFNNEQKKNTNLKVRKKRAKKKDTELN